MDDDIPPLDFTVVAHKKESASIDRARAYRDAADKITFGKYSYSPRFAALAITRRRSDEHRLLMRSWALVELPDAKY